MKKLAFAFIGACFLSFIPSAPAEANASCGKLEVAKGDVKIISGSSKTPTAAAQGARLCAGDTVITGADSRAKAVMPDGNQLNISPDSKIVIETYEFKPADNKKKVLLNVLQGKIRAATKKENMYNDTAKDGQANTFRVRTKSAVAGVRGTDFLTGFDPKSNKMEVVTFKGKVEVGQLGPAGSLLNPVQVGVGQMTEAIVGQPPAPPKVVPPQQFNNLNLDSSADSAAPSASASPVGSEATANASTESNTTEQSSSSSGERQPSSAKAPAPKSGGTSMINTGGGEGPARGIASTTPTLLPPPPAVPVVPVLPMPPSVPVCDFCNQAIQNGPSKLNIIVEVK